MTTREKTRTPDKNQTGKERYCYDHPRPAVTVDIVLVAFLDQELKVLLIKRRAEPFAGEWALPGGFVDMDETLDSAARRELREETGVHADHVEQLHTFGAPERDPRGRVISVAHLALVRPEKVGKGVVQAADDAADARWWSLDDPPTMAFDHDQVLAQARSTLRAMLARDEITQRLLPEVFTLSMLQRLHERVLDAALDKRNFRRKYLDKGVLIATGDFSTGDHRPARLYRFAVEAE